MGRCSGWEQAALCLRVQSLVIETENWNNPSNAEEACRGVLRKWLQRAPGTGETERTWHSVLEALETSGHSQLAEQLKRDYFAESSEERPIPVMSVGESCESFLSRVELLWLVSYPQLPLITIWMA